MPGKALQTQVVAGSTQTAFPVWLWLNPALLSQSSPENGEENEDLFMVRRLWGGPGDQRPSARPARQGGSERGQSQAPG